MTVKNEKNDSMNTVYVINNNGELLPDFFESNLEAEEYITGCDDEDQYLMSVVKMTEIEFYGLLTIQNFFDNESERVDLKKAIDESGNSNFIYTQLAVIVSDNWVNDRYLQHVKFSLLSGGYITGEDSFESVDMLTFNDYCDKLRKEIDFAQDYDSALKKYSCKG